jgi:hypothetical protein
MSPINTQQREPGEIPLAHDAATWDEETFESGWDDEQEQLVRSWREPPENTPAVRLRIRGLARPFFMRRNDPQCTGFVLR